MPNAEACRNWVQKMRVDEDEIDEYLCICATSNIVTLVTLFLG